MWSRERMVTAVWYSMLNFILGSSIRCFYAHHHPYIDSTIAFICWYITTTYTYVCNYIPPPCTQTNTTQCKWSICVSGWKEKHHQCKLQRLIPPCVQVQCLRQMSRYKVQRYHRKLKWDAATTCNSNHHHHRPAQAGSAQVPLECTIQQSLQLV